MSREQVVLSLEAGFHTFNCHVESRVASLLGEGFYTIGPCGEELIAGVGAALRTTDPSALHYRHLAFQMARRLLSADSNVKEILLDRARGFTVSALDPVTGGNHCSLGGGPSDFLVTSTLASQATPAVGRALGTQLAYALGVGNEYCKFPRDSLSFVSFGDGSVNNSHFLSAANMALYAQHRRFKCPTLFCVTDNDICISLKGHQWLPQFIKRYEGNSSTGGMPVYCASGWDLADIFYQTSEAAKYVRKKKRPALLIINKVPRRFGHAATDRQAAYYSHDEISAVEEADPLALACEQAIKQGIVTRETLLEMFSSSAENTANAFSLAADEPKLSNRSDQIKVCAAELAPALTENFKASKKAKKATKKKSDVMRKWMNRVIDESLSEYPEMVYIGEDVEHGGYYLVSDGLAKKYPGRCSDFPPDETSLLGAGIGYSQIGLLPCVEIPYAKYLDCAADIFAESCIANWLSNGRQPNGMLIRLQGFDKGIFGGNFHTHQALTLHPGLDVVCYSNGADYVRGFRYALRQAKAGRVVMTVDSTALLNERHLHERDSGWTTTYPERENYAKDELTFDEVIVRPVFSKNENELFHGNDIAVVTYGNGVLTSLRAGKQLYDDHGIQITVIDTPYISGVPGQLPDVLDGFDRVIFADVCKEGQNPLSGMIMRLKNGGNLPSEWASVSALNSYNPLGSLITFLNEEDIVEKGVELLKACK
eukprot:g1865.t1